MAVFDSTYDAVRAAVAVQQEIAREGRGRLRTRAVRVGINVGEVIGDDVDDTFGAAVVVARQLCDAAGRARSSCPTSSSISFGVVATSCSTPPATST